MSHVGIVSDFHRMIVFDETNINAMSGVMRNEYVFCAFFDPRCPWEASVSVRAQE